MSIMATLGFDVRRITRRRVVDINDRALRAITVGLGGRATVHARMASTSSWPGDHGDLLSPTSSPICGASGRSWWATRASISSFALPNLGANGALTVLLKDAGAEPGADAENNPP
jgi:formate--tetrahydrofolate ligase